jgi:hypothetical protein
MQCECLCPHDSWFILNLIVILLHLLVGCNGCKKKKIITNKFRNPFQQEFSYMHNL